MSLQTLATSGCGCSDGLHLELPGNEDGREDSVSLGSRRYSARGLSQSVQQTLRQIRRDAFQTRVAQLVSLNAAHYKKQRVCECVIMMLVLTIFTSFTLYVVFAYGYHLGKPKPFSLRNQWHRKIVKETEDWVDLMCQADTYWEWCRWIHSDRFCDFEWISSVQGPQMIGCDFGPDKVQLIGQYDQFECGLRVQQLGPKDRGIWQCEVEKYYAGFSRRYGEIRTAMINLVVKSGDDAGWGDDAEWEERRTALTSSPMPPPSPALTSSQSQATNHTTAVNPETDRMEYERKFFLLKLMVLGGVGFVLATLTTAFWVYFMYLWKTWESGKKECSAGSGPLLARPSCSQQPDAEDALLNPAISQSRRKSVSFAVCTLDEDTMSFNIEHKSVLLGNPGLPPIYKSSSSPSLANMARKLTNAARKKMGVKSRAASCDMPVVSHAFPTCDIIEIFDEHGRLVGTGSGQGYLHESTM